MPEKWPYECSPLGGCGRKFHSLKDFDAHMRGADRICLPDEDIQTPFLPPQEAPGARLGRSAP